MDYKEAYFRLCPNLYNLNTSKGVAKHNATMRELQKVLDSARNEEDKSFYLELLNADDVRVLITVAAACLKLNVFVEEAEKVLSSLAENKTDATVSLSANLTLLVWKNQGYL